MNTSRNPSIHGQWSSRMAFILAATGSAVGLGNIWKFPYEAGQNGGGAFVITYIICVMLIGLPIMVAEILIGRRGRESPIGSLSHLARESHYSSFWGGIGAVGMLAGLIILSFYSIIAGWAVAYTGYAATGELVNIDKNAANSLFTALTSNPLKLLILHTLFLGITFSIAARGVSNGLEKLATYGMPLLFALLLLLVGYAVIVGDFSAAFHYLLYPDFSRINGSTVLTAMGQAFFSLSLGMGALMVYGAFLPDDVSIGRSAMMVGAADTLVAIMAGFAVFPIVMAHQIEPGQGPGLIFQSLPLAFSAMPFGQLFATLFFSLVVLAALTSAVSLVEPSVTWLVEKYEARRSASAFLVGIICWILGIGSLLSFNLWSNKTWLNRTFFDWMDYLTSNIMLPLGGLGIAVFCGWIMHSSHSKDELQGHNHLAYPIWRFLIRYIAPLAVLIIFVSSII